jgi:hypothetical protein
LEHLSNMTLPESSPNAQLQVRREFLIDRQGKTFVLYAGLLDLAHAMGLEEIDTQLLQVPSDENGQVAIVRARVITKRGRFSGIGDASPANVARAMLTATIRLAETRAKARALRDAVNVGVVAFEELGENVDEMPQVSPLDHYQQQAAQPQRAEQQQPAQSSNPNIASPAQVRAIYAIARDTHGLNEKDVDARSQSVFGVSPVDLTRKQASDFITSLKGEDRRPQR